MQGSGGSMSKVRVYEVAKQLSLDPKAVVALFQAVGINDVRNHMSSVDTDAIERVKRHLEKQKGPVVEERIRPGVLKRRTVAKAGVPEAPASVPAAPASVPAPSRVSHPALPEDRESTRGLPDSPNGHAAVPTAEPSSRRIPSPRESHGDVAVSAERASARDLEPARPAPSEESSRDVTERASTRQLTKAEEPVATSSEASDTPNHHMNAPPQIQAVATDASPAPDVAGPRVAVAASSEEPARREEPVVPAPVVVTAPPAAPARPSTVPKTGVEYWAGRPGVPMPTPLTAPRTAIGGGAAGAMPRRVQYDPRAGASTGAAPRRDVRAGGPQQGRSMMRGAGGAGPRKMFGQQPQRRPSGIVSTQEMGAHKKVIRIDENVTLQTMAQKMSVKSTELLMKLLSMGMTGVHINTTLDADTAKILASEFGWDIEDVAQSEEESIAAARGEEGVSSKAATAAAAAADPNQVTRPPVVTVMGHVDHGKTSLLDRIRKANIAGGEAGGITQHIGAYKAETPHGTIVFLDTPGHEAFTQMRARGASGADIVVLVVAADDGVMPQTKEAYNHAKAAGVPIIVAVNKSDKASADPERARRELAELGLQPEEWGGETMFVNVSALTGAGIEQLLENIALQAEVLDLKANPDTAASGTVLEALLDRGRGPVARVLVQDGTLKVGDFILAGSGFGKVRAMTNEHGKNIHSAGPSTPVEILGLSDVPGAGDPMHVVKDPKKAQEIAESRRGKMAKSLIPSTAKVSLEELSKRMADEGQQELRIILKGDVQGSVEAVADALAKLSTDRVRLSIIHAAVGAITEGDVNLAIASKAIVIGFNVRPAGKSTALAEENKVEIRLYSIIYNAIDDVKGAMEGLLPPTLVERSNGKAEVRQVFKVKNVAVAGCYVVSGVIKRSAKMRLLRGTEVMWEGKVAALKRFKDDVKDVAEGFECGISLDGYNDMKELDIIECYEIDEVKQKL